MTQAAKKVGERIRMLRRAQGLTQAQLADKAGTHRPIVGRIERGVCDPKIPTLAAYARALGVPLWAIVAAATKEVPCAVRQAKAAGGQ